MKKRYTSYYCRWIVCRVVYQGKLYNIYIDLIADGRHLFDELLVKELGFQKIGRSWYSKELEISIEIPSDYLEGSREKVVQIDLPNGYYIYAIGIEDIIVHRLESAVVSQSNNPEWTEDYNWAKRMFEIHKSDKEILDIDYFKRASGDVKVNSIIKEWVQGI